MEFVVLYGKTLGVRDGDFDRLCCRNVEEEEEHVYATVHPPNLLQTTATSLAQQGRGGGGGGPNYSILAAESPNRLAARTGGDTPSPVQHILSHTPLNYTSTNPPSNPPLTPTLSPRLTL